MEDEFDNTDNTRFSDQLSVPSLSLIKKKENRKESAFITLNSQQQDESRRSSMCSRSSSSGSSSTHESRPVLMIRLADVQHRLYLAESHVRLYMATTKINSVIYFKI